MQDLLQQLLDHVRGLWRFRRWGMAVAWAVCAIGWLVVIALPPVYEANSRVYVDATAVLRPLLAGIAVEQDVGAQLNFVRQALLSRPQLERVARETDLDLEADTPAEKEKLLADLRDDIVIESVNESAVQGGRRDESGSSLFRISYRADSKDDALNVVRTLVTSFVEDTLGGKRSGSEAAQRFLQEQVRGYDQRLADAEMRLAEFKKKYLGLTPGAGGDFFSRLQVAEDGIQRTQASLNVALNRRAVLDRQIKGEQAVLATPAGSVPGAQGAGLTTMTSLQIQQAEERLQDLLTRYTEKHPDVVATQETLKQLRARQELELAEMRRSAAAGQSVSGLNANPVYQQIQAQLNQVDVEIAALRSELSVHQQNAARLRGMMDTAPEVEAEYARLMRDYDVVKAQYNELVSRLDRAKISEEAEQTGVIRFEVIDPPSVNIEPVAPNRPLLIALVLLTGLLAGFGLAFVLNQTRPVFDNVRSLSDVTGLPVLGAVSRTWRQRHRAERKLEIVRLAAAGGALIVVFGVVLWLQGPISRALHALV
jgi:polysaccharide chain length determinant protein (PEP-CTERM system associated)